MTKKDIIQSNGYTWLVPLTWRMRLRILLGAPVRVYETDAGENTVVVGLVVDRADFVQHTTPHRRPA
jgi:hypothetical protein